LLRASYCFAGFEIEVREIKNVFKLSQDRDEPSYDNIMQELDKQDGDARTIAQEMRKRKAQLFVRGQQNPGSSPSKSP
jgi:transcriptional regulator